MHSVTSTGILALLTCDAGAGTNLHGLGTLVHVHTSDHKRILVRTTHVAHLHDATWTSLLASATSSTLLCIHFWQPRLGVHVECIELTGCHTVATAQTAVGTKGLTHTCGVGHTTTHYTIVGQHVRTFLTSAVASNDGQFGSRSSNFHSQDTRNLLHALRTTYRTVQSFERTSVGSLHTSRSHTATTRETATATVGARQHFKHLTDSGIFLHCKPLRHHKEQQCKHEAQDGQSNHSNQNYLKIHKMFI